MNKNKQIPSFISCRTRDIELLSKRIPTRIHMPLILHQIRNRRRLLPAVHLSDKSQRRVDARRHARRSPHVAVDDPPRFRHPLGPGPVDDGARPRGLVRRRAAAVEHAGACHDGGAGADGDQVAQVRVRRLDVGDRGVEVGRARPEAARDHEDFNVFWGCCVCVRWEDLGELCVRRRSFTSALGGRNLGAEADAPLKEGNRCFNPGNNRKNQGVMTYETRVFGIHGSGNGLDGDGVHCLGDEI